MVIVGDDVDVGEVIVGRSGDGNIVESEAWTQVLEVDGI